MPRSSADPLIETADLLTCRAAKRR